jgi:riboflavin kinase/FMN adenylyltransferase
MLGRPFTLEGRVRRGEGRGASLGFPTANLEVDPSLAVPGDGIYATWVDMDGVRLASATSIGVRPTFGAGARTIETHIMDFNGDLYDRKLRLLFARHLREERRFDSVEALVAQMHRDVAEARGILEKESQSSP